VTAMAQAKRKKKASKTSAGFTLSGHGLGMLAAGVVIGSLGTVLWQGLRSNDSDVGSGIRQMIETSRQQAEVEEEVQPTPQVAPEPQSTNYDFFTVLPEIEVVVTDDDEGAVQPQPPIPAPQSEDASEGNKPEVSEAKIEPVASAYMLQAGSYNRQADAERQKANLALMGLTSAIQKVTIEGRGDFYRVRLGPFSNHGQMVDIDERLKQEGIKAMRLKISRSG